MKKFNIYIAMGLTALVAVTSCKKIALTPTFIIAETQSFNSVLDAKAWDNGLYASLRGRQNGSYTLQTDIAGDQLNAGLDYGNNFGSPHRWDASYTAQDQTLTPIWNNYYTSIANLNTVIANFPTIPTNSAADVASMNQYTGDAYLARAWYYHRLILRWAKPYEPATAATDLGVPLVLKFNLTELPTRATVQAVYNQILADITQAETLLANIPGGNTAAITQVFNIDAARALEARVRLYMHDYAGAYAAANTLITGGKYPLITTAAAMSTYWKNDGTQESITQLYVNNTTETPQSMSTYLIPKSATNYDPYYVPSQWVLDMYAATDIRKPAFFTTAYPIVVQGVSYPTVFAVGKFQGNPALYTGALTNAYQAPKVFRIGEMYLIAAEAAFSLSNTANAIAAINPLRVARGETALVLPDATLQQDIRDERFRELAFEGFRLDDLKRWHLGFTRSAPQNNNMCQQGANYTTLSIPADHVFFTWGIPANDIIINPNLVQNPGW